LQIPRRTFYRLLNAVFEDDRRLLAENMDDTEKLNQIIICRERWLAQRREVLEMNKAPGFNDEAKIDGEHLAAVLAWGAKEINIRGAALLGHSYPYQFPKYSSLVAAGSTTTNLRLKDPRTGQVIRYERMQYVWHRENLLP
jgi:hypothetical protein